MQRLCTAACFGFIFAGSSAHRSLGQIGPGSITIPASQVRVHPAPKTKSVQGKDKGSELGKVAQLSDERTVPLDVDDRRGQGFDVFTGEILPATCVDVDFPQDIQPGNDTSDVDLSHRVKDVTSLSDLRSHSGTEAGASLTYKLFSIGGSTSFYRDDYFRSWFHYIDFNIEVTKHYFTFTPDHVSNVALSAAAQGRFKEVCGEMFISRVNYGASMKGQAVLQTKDQDAQHQTSSSVSLGISGLLGAHGSNTTATNTINENSTYDNEVVVLGAPAAVTSGIDTVIQTAYNFPTLIGGANSIISYELTPYKRLQQAPPAQYEPVPEAALAALVPLASKRDRALQQANDLRFGMGKPMYQGGSAEELHATEKYLQSIAVVVDTCENSPIATCTSAANTIGDVPSTTLKLK